MRRQSEVSVINMVMMKVIQNKLNIETTTELQNILIRKGIKRLYQ